MSPPRKTPPNGAGAPFYTCRVRQTIQGVPPGAVTHGYIVERRSRWWPFWRADREFYTDRTEAITAAQSVLLVDAFLRRAADVIWEG